VTLSVAGFEILVLLAAPCECVAHPLEISAIAARTTESIRCISISSRAAVNYENTVHCAFPINRRGITVQVRNSIARYGALAQLFHWIIVALIITQYVLAWQADHATGLHKIAPLIQHKSIGMTVLALAVLRLLWRWSNPPPALPAHMPKWERWAAHASHFLLYVFLFLQPVSGLLMSQARNYQVSWFGLFTFPALIAPDKQAYDFLVSVHGLLATALFCVALLHIAAALKHHLFDKDDVLRRMLPVRLRGDNKPG
jgi:cytochrome b561